MSGQHILSFAHLSYRWRGYTLIELMIAVAVIAVIVAVAYPAYTDFILRSRRSEATEALQNAATLEEKYYNHNKQYSDSLAALPMPATTENDYYHLSISAGATVAGLVQSYTLSASAKGSQAADTACAVIKLDSNVTKTPSGCW